MYLDKTTPKSVLFYGNFISQLKIDSFLYYGLVIASFSGFEEDLLNGLAVIFTIFKINVGWFGPIW